jgi:hypothetical protein
MLSFSVAFERRRALSPSGNTGAVSSGSQTWLRSSSNMPSGLAARISGVSNSPALSA